MKKVFVIFVAMLLMATGVLAAKQTCTTVQSGTLTDVKGNFISTGYDQWGYNYQAHMFNGIYDNYARPETVATEGDRLMMKWNDAWLSNKDCNGDTKLDRPANYIGSGAWLTNHASGTYMSTLDGWDVTGTYNINVNYNSVDYPELLVLTQYETAITGVSLDTVPAASYFAVYDGSVVGTDVNIFAKKGSLIVHMVGTIAADGSMSGTWHDEPGTGTRTGTWTTTAGAASGTLACVWSDFVKIVAVPADAVEKDGNWYTPEEVLIGPSIWGSFAIIQEVSTDPCGQGVDLMNFKSEFKNGLGNW